MDALSSAAKGLAFTDDLEKSEEERLNMIYEKIKVWVCFFFWKRLVVTTVASSVKFGMGWVGRLKC